MTERVLWTEIDGVQLAYREEAAGTLVLLLHGFPDTARTWTRSLSFLADHNFRAVVPFQRGYFPSEIPADGDYSIRRLAADALALIDRLGATKAIIIGHDWGALAAYAAAALAPEKLPRSLHWPSRLFSFLKTATRSAEYAVTTPLSDVAKSRQPRCRRTISLKLITCTHYGARIGRAHGSMPRG
jgi:pimeloyl-ACP methyl ester carboxylesterase